MSSVDAPPLVLHFLKTRLPSFEPPPTKVNRVLLFYSLIIYIRRRSLRLYYRPLFGGSVYHETCYVLLRSRGRSEGISVFRALRDRSGQTTEPSVTLRQ